MRSTSPRSAPPTGSASQITPAEAAVAEKLVDPDFAEALARVGPSAEPFPWDSLPIDGPLRDAVEWIEACNTRSLPLAALGAALVGFGGACARRLYIRWSEHAGARPTPIHQPVIVIARTGAGKDAPLRAARTMVEAAGYKTLSALPFHHVTLYAELVLSGGALGLMLDEVDGTFASLMAHNEHAAAKDAAVKTMLSSGDFLPAPPVSSGNVQFKRVAELKGGERAWTDGVQNPALVLFGVSTRQVLDRLASNVAGGLAGRMLVIDSEGDLAPSKSPEANTAVMPDSVREWIEVLRPTSLENAFSIDELEPPMAVIAPTPGALTAATRRGDHFTQASNAAARDGNQHLADLLARGIEATLRVAATLAVAGATDPRGANVEAEHVNSAYRLVRWCIHRLANETEQREDTSGPAKTARVIRARLAKDAMRRGAASPWHFRVRVVRGHETYADQVIRTLEASGEVTVEGKRLALTSRL